MSIEVNGNTLDTDDRHGWRKCRKRRSSFPAEEGFLLDPGQWNEVVAQHIADGERLELTVARWEIVRYVREHFESRAQSPKPVFCSRC